MHRQFLLSLCSIACLTTVAQASDTATLQIGVTVLAPKKAKTFEAPADIGDVPAIELMVAEGQEPQVTFGPLMTLPDGRLVVVVDIFY